MPDMTSANAGRYVVLESATTAQLASLTSVINKRSKKAGKLCFNSTTGAVVVATGATAAAVWNTAAGAAAHTPV